MTQKDIEEAMGTLHISGSSSHDEQEDNDNAQSQASDMQRRARILLEELDQLQQYLKDRKRERSIYLTALKSDIQLELKLLEKISDTHTTDEKILHTLRSSNFPFFEHMWSAAKTSSGLVGFRKWFPMYPKDKMPEHAKNKTRLFQAMVDIIGHNGLEWIKVSATTEKRIIWDLAKAGYAGASSDEEYSDDELEESVGILKQAKALVKAANAIRIRYRHPSVRLILPRIRRDCPKHVKTVLDQIRALGVTVETAEDICVPKPMDEVVHRLASDRYESFSETVNLDCTVLLALVSDLSHGQVEPQDWHNIDIARQIKLEKEDQLLPNSLWPACGDRKMVCTREAASRMHEIVSVVGTETEKRRAALLVHTGDGASLKREQIRKEFQELSDYKLPPAWNLPVTVADFDLDSLTSSLPPIAAHVGEALITINQSVFFYGWSSGYTTLSSNGAVAKAIEAKIEENRVSDEDTGPDIWLCPMSRSLVGKEKERRGGDH